MSLFRHRYLLGWPLLRWPLRRSIEWLGGWNIQGRLHGRHSVICWLFTRRFFHKRMRPGSVRGCRYWACFYERTVSYSWRVITVGIIWRGDVVGRSSSAVIAYSCFRWQRSPTGDALHRVSLPLVDMLDVLREPGALFLWSPWSVVQYNMLIGPLTGW